MEVQSYTEMERRTEPSRPQPMHCISESAINQLPTELLEQIFQRCIPEGAFIQPNPKVAPLIFRDVCWEWRQRCTSMTSLWSSIHIRCTRSQRRPMPVDMVEAWINRSGSRLLSLSLGNGSSIYSNAILRVFCTNISRLKRIHLNVMSDVRIDAETCRGLLHPSEAAVLEEISIIIQQDGSADHFLRWLFSATTNTPLLHTVRSGSSLMRSPTIQLPWPQLTHFESRDFLSPSQCLDMLMACPQLRTCDFDVDNEDEDSPMHSIVRHSLQVLRMNFEAHWEPLLNQLLLPDLCDLTIERVDLFLPFSLRISSFLFRSSPPLESLHLFGTQIATTDLIEGLSCISATLVSLCLEENARRNTITDDLLTALTYRNGNILLCPQLRSLSLSRCISSSDDRCADMVESRLGMRTSLAMDLAQPPCARLASVSFLFSKKVQHISDLRRLGELSARGIEVKAKALNG